MLISTNSEFEPDAAKRYPVYSSDPTLGQKADGEINVRFSNLKPNTKFRFIVRDLPDESPYARLKDNKKTSGDNLPAGNGEYGSLDCVSDPNHEHHGRVVYAKTDANGKVTMKLTITDRYAGNNYRIDVTPVGNTKQILASSPVLVAWKRVYLEVDRMYRKGSNVTGIVPSGSPSILVEDVNPFAIGDTVRVFTYNDQAGEIRIVTAINQLQGETSGSLALNSPLINLYPQGEDVYVAVDNDLYYIGLDWVADAYGSANARFSQPQRDEDLPIRTQEDVITGKERGAFVDFRLVPDNKNPKRLMPQTETIQDIEGGLAISNVYFDNSSYGDVVHVMAFNKIWSDELIRGLARSLMNWSSVACGYLGDDGTTNDPAGLTGPRRSIEQTLAHELGHQFMQPKYTDGNHSKKDVVKEYQQKPCLMFIGGHPEYQVGTGYYCEFCDPCLYRIRKSPLDLWEMP